METIANVPLSMQRLIDGVKDYFQQRPKLLEMFETCLPHNYRTTLRQPTSDTTFVITGDIPAMWLRDSAAQVRTYLLLAAEDPQIAALLEGVVKQQLNFILIDPYANAFNQVPNGEGHQDDITEMNPWLWERKYEIDSLCYPLQLAYLLWRATGSTRHFDATFRTSVEAILDLWKTEQNHMTRSPYYFERKDCPETDTLPNAGRGSAVAYTGMTWSGFRPSDDACTYGYNVPSNAFAVVVLGYLTEIATQVLEDAALASKTDELANEIRRGIEEFGTFEHPQFGKIYAYEVDGLGNYLAMDDANIPSLLSLPYLGYCTLEDSVYQATRRFVLSSANPFYFEGRAARGVGSPHTGSGQIWHLGIIMQALTATSSEECEELLNSLERTDANTSLLHESFDADDPSHYTRAWFGWANALFCELVLSLCDKHVAGSPLEGKSV